MEIQLNHDDGFNALVHKIPIVVLISGYGSNLQAIMNAIPKDLPVDIRCVISNQPKAYGIERARKAGIPTHTIPHKNYTHREDFDDALIQHIDRYQPRLVILAGFMRQLGPQFVDHYYNRLINIHPSLLPKFRGLHTHENAINNGETFHGSTIYYVRAKLDNGPIICQAKLKIKKEDDPSTLKKRVQQLEYHIYPRVLAWIAEGRIAINNNIVSFDGKPLSQNGLQFTINHHS